MSWTYKLSATAQTKKSAKEFLTYEPYNRYFAKYSSNFVYEPTVEDNLAPSFERFFNHPYIKKLVENNEWDKVIDAWENDFDKARGAHSKNQEVYGNRIGWDASLLTDTLALAGIDFWTYLPDDFIPLKYCLEDNIEWSE